MLGRLSVQNEMPENRYQNIARISTDCFPFFQLGFVKYSERNEFHAS